LESKIRIKIRRRLTRLQEFFAVDSHHEIHPRLAVEMRCVTAQTDAPNTPYALSVRYGAKRRA